MSDEIRTEGEDVEAHGPVGLEGPNIDAPLEAPGLEATGDGEPDVEAHGPVGSSPSMDAPVTDLPTAE